MDSSSLIAAFFVANIFAANINYFEHFFK